MCIGYSNSTNNTRYSGVVLTPGQMEKLVGADWIYFSSGPTWNYNVSPSFVGTLWAPVVNGGTFTWTKHIDFHGLSGSTDYLMVTVNDWGNDIGYTLNMTLNVYAGTDWSGGIIYQSTQSCTLIKGVCDSYTLVYQTPELADKSYTWSGSCYEAIPQNTPTIQIVTEHPGMRWNWQNELMLFAYAEGAYFSGIAAVYTWPIALTGPVGAAAWGGEVTVFTTCTLGFITNLYNSPWVPVS